MTSSSPNPVPPWRAYCTAPKVGADLPARFAAAGLRLCGERVKPACEVPGLSVLVGSGIGEPSATGFMRRSHDDDT